MMFKYLRVISTLITVDGLAIKKYNKAFKSDSQRLEFLVLLQVKCLWHNPLG